MFMQPLWCPVTLLEIKTKLCNVPDLSPLKNNLVSSHKVKVSGVSSEQQRMYLYVHKDCVNYIRMDRQRDGWMDGRRTHKYSIFLLSFLQWHLYICLFFIYKTLSSQKKMNTSNNRENYSNCLDNKLCLIALWSIVLSSHSNPCNLSC